MEKKTLLIVDDQADTRLVLSAWLKAHHYHTVFAANAPQVMSVALKSVLAPCRESACSRILGEYPTALSSTSTAIASARSHGLANRFGGAGVALHLGPLGVKAVAKQLCTKPLVAHQAFNTSSLQ